jgi:uncharacterized coiled-coil protein SlyX
MKTPEIKSIGRSPLRLGFLLITFALGCFALSPGARAACQEGCSDFANTFLGDDALPSNTTGHENTAIGFDSLYSNTTGAYNTAVGSFTLRHNTGSHNTAVGAGAMDFNTTGDSNVAIGDGCFSYNTTGSSNTAVGNGALFNNTTGNENTATGVGALLNNNADDNTAVGASALFSNTTGANNTATGWHALVSNTTGDFNMANGFGALQSNTEGIANTASGVLALNSNITGFGNTATGSDALNNNTAGSFNIALGRAAGSNLTTGNNNIDIANAGVAGESNAIRIGTQGTQKRTFIAGISTTGVMGSAVKISGSGQLGVAPSSARFKQQVKSMDKASDVLLALRPVTFRYKPEIDPDGVPQFGLVAEDVEKVNSDLVARDAEGKVYTVRYEAVNAMLLNEFLKEHRKVEEQEAAIAQLKSTLAKQETIDARQQEQIEALTAGLQKVSAQVEMTKPAPQMVVNNQ